MRERASRDKGIWIEWVVGATFALWTVMQLLTFHSSLLASAWSGLPSVLPFCRALVFGALLVSIAYRGVSCTPRARIVLLVALVVALFYRARAGEDNRLIMLVLFLMASKDMDPSRLIRCYLVGACVTIVALFFLTRIALGSGLGLIGTFMQATTQGMEHAKTFACLLLGVSAGLAASIKTDSRLWIPACVICALCGVFCLVALHLSICGLIQLLLAAGIAFSALAPHVCERITGARATRIAVAAIPIALCVLMLVLTVLYDPNSPFFTAIDKVLFGRLSQAHAAFAYAGPYVGVGRLDQKMGELAVQGQFMYYDDACGYVFWALNYGLVPMALIAALYVNTVLTSEGEPQIFPIWLTFVLIGAFLLFETSPSLLELNPSILLLAAGLGSTAPESQLQTPRLVIGLEEE